MRPSTARLLAVALLALTVLSGCRNAGKPPGAGGAPDAAGSGGGGSSMVAEWRWEAPPRASVGMPAANGDELAFTYGHLRLALYGADGTPRWEVERVGLRDVAPRLTPDLVVAATDDGLVAVDRAAGHERWHAELGERANAPVMAAGLAVVSTWEGSLVALDSAGGQVTWRATLPGPAVGPAATSPDGTVVVATWESEHGDAAGAVAVDAATGGGRWAVPLEPGGVSAPAVTAAGTVVVVAGDLAAHGLALATGEPRWRVVTGGAGSPEVPPLVLGDSTVLVAHRLGGMAMVDEGDLRWQASADAAVVRGGATGPGPRGRFALPLDDGRLLVAGPDREEEILDPPGRVSGVAVGGGLLLVATRGAEANALVALNDW